jgi:hypothetical protein
MVTLSACLLLVMATQSNPAAGGRLAGAVADAATGMPVVGARVTVDLVVDTPNGSLGRDSRQTTTDDGGRFSFDLLPAGSYQIGVEKTGFAPYPEPSFDKMPDRVTIMAGRASASLTIALHKAAVLAGRIVSKTGEPEAGLQVSALKRTGLGGVMAFVPAGGADTNDLGEYRIAALAAGDYLIVASPHHGDPFTTVQTVSSAASSTTLAPTYFPGTIDQEAAQVLSLQAGQTSTNLEFAITTVAAFRVSGVAVDKSGAPSPNAMVMLMPDLRGGLMFEPMMRMSGEDGTFTFTNVVPGTYRISASPGDAGGMGGFSISVGESGASALPGTTVSVATANITGLKVPVDRN